VARQRGILGTDDKGDVRGSRIVPPAWSKPPHTVHVALVVWWCLVSDYAAFLDQKRHRVEPVGFDVPSKSLNDQLFDWQKVVRYDRHAVGKR
jgi:hypothetical protein